MPTSCCVYGCKNRHVKGIEIQFFSFPFKDPHRLAAWIAAIRRKDWNPTKATRICSEHFTPSDFLKRPGAYIKHIKPNAVPSVFKAFPNHLQPEEKAARNESNLCEDIKLDCEPRCSTEPPNVYQRVEHVVLIPEESRIDNVEDASSDSEESLVPHLKHKIRMLQQKLRRKEKQIEKMSTLLSEAKKKTSSTFSTPLITPKLELFD